MKNNNILFVILQLLFMAIFFILFPIVSKAKDNFARVNENAPSQTSKKISGKVADTFNHPLIGVSVVQQGSTNGTITNIEGNYTLTVPVGANIVFSYIGYSTQTHLVSSETLNVILDEDSRILDEVVVVGYGVQHRKDITGSVAVVNTKDLLASSGSSATQQLQGKAAGVYIGQSGSPGSPAMVRIRGINSVNDNSPLYVIDGVSTRNQDLNSMNPNDIESIQVLKDASSAAIYGAQAANGVILITTKRGLKGGGSQPTISYDGYFGVQKTGKGYDLLNSTDRLNLEWDAKKGNYDILGITDRFPSHVQFGTGPKPIIPNFLTQAGSGGRQDIDPASYQFPNNTLAPFSNTNWWDAIDKTAMMQNHQLAANGGSDKGSYSFSLNYFDQDGTAKYSNYKRYQIRVNTAFDLRTWLRVGENMTYAYSKDINLNAEGTESNPYSWTYRASPYVPVKDLHGNFAGSKFAGTGNFRNPVATNYRAKDGYYSRHRVFGNIWGEADLYKDLMLRTSFGMDYTNNYSYRMSKREPEFSENTGQNNLHENAGFSIRWVWTNTLSYKLTIAEKNNFTLLLGTEAIKDNIGRRLEGRRYGYVFEDDTNTWILDLGENDSRRLAESNYKNEFRLFGMFGRLDYAFDNKYLFTGIMRRDGVSRFSTSNRYAMFPSVSAGWRLSEEKFMASTRSWLDDLKFRVGYGQTGNSEIDRADNFANLYNTNPKQTNYDISGSNDNAATGYRIGAYGNAETKWETTSAYNLGIDGTFLGGRFGIGAEWYYKKTTDMLVRAPYSATAGEASRPYINIGDMKNVGVDLNLYYRDRRGDWGWDFDLNVSHYKNTVLKLSDTDDFSMWGNGQRLSGSVTRTTKGHAISQFYGYKVDGFYETPEEVMKTQPLGANITNIEDAKRYVGKFKFKDTTGDNRITADDRTFIGSPHPDVMLALNTTVSWKEWDLTAFWYSTIGNQLFNNTKYFTDFWLFEGNRSSRLRDRSWKPGSTDAILPILDYGDAYSGTNPSSYYVENASFLRLKNLIVGYTIPTNVLKKTGISNLRVYVQAENLFTITGYTGLDPEFTNANVGEGTGSDIRKGIDMGGWPTTKRFLFGLNVSF